MLQDSRARSRWNLIICYENDNGVSTRDENVMFRIFVFYADVCKSV